jgi:hypothetical protein
VDHPIAVERVIPTQAWQERVLGVAEVDAIEASRDSPSEDIERGGVILDDVGAPGAGSVGVVVLGWE